MKLHSCFLLPCKFFKWHLFLYGINWKLYFKKKFFFFLHKISVRMLAFNSGRNCHHSLSWEVICDPRTDAGKKLLLWTRVVHLPQGFASLSPQKGCLRNIRVKAITGVSVFAGLWGVSTGNWAELCLEEVNDVKIYLPCTENFSSNETPPTPSGTK